MLAKVKRPVHSFNVHMCAFVHACVCVYLFVCVCVLSNLKVIGESEFQFPEL